LYLSSLSHLRARRVRRILHLAGYDLRVGLPGAQDLVALWGTGRTAARGRWLAAQRGAGLLHLEDGFLRSVLPGRSGAPTLSLIADRGGAYYDAGAETDLERLLRTHPLDDPVQLARAEALLEHLTRTGISKYNAARGTVPPEGFVLVVDQTYGDRAIAGAGADKASFAEMLRAAIAENPGRRILVQSHPETALGLRQGYFETLPEEVSRLSQPARPHALLAAAHRVYTVSSQIGFEAILAGHRPVVFGQAFYSGWGLSDDRAPALAQRGRPLSRAQLALGALITYPLWFDPYADRLCGPEQVIAALTAQARAHDEDADGYAAFGFRLWKRATVAGFFRDGPVRFAPSRAEAAKPERA